MGELYLFTFIIIISVRHVAPQHGDRIVTIDHYDVTAPLCVEIFGQTFK